MKSIIVTRPKERAEAFGRQLEELGYRVTYQPALEITSLPFEAPKNIDIIITTSQYAIEGLEKTKDLDTKLYVVGDASKNKAEHLGFNNIITAGGTADRLVELIKISEPKDKNILYLRGNEVRLDIANILRNDGYKIDEIIAYDAKPVTEIQNNVITELSQGKIDYVIFFSARSVQAFEDLIAKYNISNHLKTVKAISMSATIANSLNITLWQTSIISQGTTTQKTLDLLPSQM